MVTAQDIPCLQGLILCGVCVCVCVRVRALCMLSGLLCIHAQSYARVRSTLHVLGQFQSTV